MQSGRRRGVVDLALQSESVRTEDSPSRTATLNRLRFVDTVFRNLTHGAALGVLVLLGGVIVALFIGAWPALQTFGASFLIDQHWNPVTEKFGALAPIYGTIVT